MVASPTTYQIPLGDLPFECLRSAGIVKSARGINPESCLKCIGGICMCLSTRKTCREQRTFCTHPESGFVGKYMRMATEMLYSTSTITNWIRELLVSHFTVHCSQSPIFPWDFRDSHASIELPSSSFVTASIDGFWCSPWVDRRPLTTTLRILMSCLPSPLPTPSTQKDFGISSLGTYGLRRWYNSSKSLLAG